MREGCRALGGNKTDLVLRSLLYPFSVYPLYGLLFLGQAMQQFKLVSQWMGRNSELLCGLKSRIEMVVIQVLKCLFAAAGGSTNTRFDFITGPCRNVEEKKRIKQALWK